MKDIAISSQDLLPATEILPLEFRYIFMFFFLTLRRIRAGGVVQLGKIHLLMATPDSDLESLDAFLSSIYVSNLESELTLSEPGSENQSFSRGGQKCPPFDLGVWGH